MIRYDSFLAKWPTLPTANIANMNICLLKTMFQNWAVSFKKGVPGSVVGRFFWPQVALWMTSMSFGAQAIGCSTGPWEILGVDPDMMYVQYTFISCICSKLKSNFHKWKQDIMGKKTRCSSCKQSRKIFKWTTSWKYPLLIYFWRLNVSWIENTTHRNEFFFLALALHSSSGLLSPKMGLTKDWNHPKEKGWHRWFVSNKFPFAKTTHLHRHQFHMFHVFNRFLLCFL